MGVGEVLSNLYGPQGVSVDQKRAVHFMGDMVVLHGVPSGKDRLCSGSKFISY